MICNLKPAPHITLGQCSGQCQGCPGLQGCTFASQGLGAINLPWIGEVDWMSFVTVGVFFAGLWLITRDPSDSRVNLRRRRRLVRARAQYQLAQL